MKKQKQGYVTKGCIFAKTRLMYFLIIRQKINQDMRLLKLKM